MSWLKLLNIELENVGSNFIEPAEAINSETDKVIGVMDDELKKIFTLAEKIREAGARMIVEAEFSRDQALKNEAEIKIRELYVKREALMKIFWVLVREKFQLWGEEGDSIGVRKGFKIVLYNQPPKSFLDFLKNL